jgi:hypothetical protein
MGGSSPPSFVPPHGAKVIDVASMDRARSARYGRHAIVCVGAELSPAFVKSKRLPTNTPANFRARRLRLRAKPAMIAPGEWSNGRTDRLR